MLLGCSWSLEAVACQHASGHAIEHSLHHPECQGTPVSQNIGRWPLLRAN